MDDGKSAASSTGLCRTMPRPRPKSDSETFRGTPDGRQRRGHDGRGTRPRTTGRALLHVRYGDGWEHSIDLQEAREGSLDGGPAVVNEQGRSTASVPRSGRRPVSHARDILVVLQSPLESSRNWLPVRTRSPTGIHLRGTMHATIDVRFELSIDDDKTIPLARLPSLSPTRISNRSSSKNWSRASTRLPSRASTRLPSRRSVARNTLTATVTSASNALAPIPAQPSQPLVNTSLPPTTSKTQPLNRTNTVTSGPSKMSSTLTARTAINGTSQPKRQSHYFAQLS